MSEAMRSIVFALVMCVICSALLTAGAVGLQPFQEKNIRIDRHRNILLAAGLLDGGQTASPAQIEDLYKKNISAFQVAADGRLEAAGTSAQEGLPLYLVLRSGQAKTYILPFNSRGLWGRIKGYLALADDGTTVKGFTVYRHQETPGLGGEIEKRWFQENFAGKKIRDKQGTLVSVSIAKGPVAETVPREKRPHYVDGISGATLTGKFLSAGLKDVLMDYEPISIRFRKNRVPRIPGTETP